MRIGTAEAKRTDRASTLICPIQLPFPQLLVDAKRAVFQFDVFIQLLEVDGRWLLFMPQRHDELDKSSHSRCRCTMTDVALHRTQRAELFVLCIFSKRLL